MSAGSGRANLTRLALAGLVGLGTLWVSLHDARTRFDLFALRSGYTARFAEIDGVPIQCSSVTARPACAYTPNLPAGAPRLLWVAASQAFSMVEYRPGDRNVVEHLAERWGDRGVALQAVTHGNATFEHLYAFFEHVRTHQGVDGLLIGAVYDDMQEPFDAGAARPFLADPKVAAKIAGTAVGRSWMERGFEAAEGGGGALATAPSRASENPTIQQRVEETLVGWLEANIGLWQTRAEARGRIETGAMRALERLGEWRRSLRGQDTKGWKRVPFPQSRWVWNWTALETMLAAAAAADIPAMIYIVPRPLHEFHDLYAPEAYAGFKADIARLAQRHHARFADIEDAVSDSHYGMLGPSFAPRRDHFHFDAGGHALMAEALARVGEPLIKDLGR